MKVYVVTGGEYSDYHIAAVFIDKEEAEKQCAVLNSYYFREFDDFWNLSYKIQEYDTDENQVEITHEIKRVFYMSVNVKNDTIKMFKGGHLVSKDINKIDVHKCRLAGMDDTIDMIATLPKDITTDRARKIMLDRIAKFKAERAYDRGDTGL